MGVQHCCKSKSVFHKNETQRVVKMNEFIAVMHVFTRPRILHIYSSLSESYLKVYKDKALLSKFASRVHTNIGC